MQVVVSAVMRGVACFVSPGSVRGSCTVVWELSPSRDVAVAGVVEGVSVADVDVVVGDDVDDDVPALGGESETDSVLTDE